jgi:peptidyl-prolyl cis-trans isomerase D
MFDLFRSRAKAVRILLGAMLLLVAISMVVTLIPGWGGGMGGPEEQVIAEIGDEVLTARELTRQMQAAMRNRNIPRNLMGVYAPQFIEQMITERAMAFEAERLGFQVSETELARAIRTALPQLFQGGQFAGGDVYAAFLAQQELTVPEFERSFRNQMLVTRLQNLVAEGVVVTPAEVEREYNRRNEKVKLEYVELNAAKYRDQLKIAPEEIRKHYEAQKSAYQLPEKRSLQMLLVDETRVGQRVQVPESELRKAYETNQENYRVPERVQVRHILLKTADKPAAEVSKVQARAEELLKQIKAGADFDELAKKNSDDTVSAAKGGDLGWVTRGQTVEAFEKAAFSLKPKELSGVIKTEYGFHILQVMDKQNAHLRPFEDVKEQIAQERKRQQVYDTMQRLADEAHAALVQRPAQAREMAQKLDLPLVSAEKVGAGDPLPELGPAREVHEAVQGLEKGSVTPVLQVGGNRLVVTVVSEVFPSRTAELAEVEGQVREELVRQRVTQLLDQTAREAAEKAKASGDLRQAAKSLGLEIKTTQEFARDGAADGIGPAGLVGEAFDLPAGTVFGPVSSGEQRFICEVQAKIAADPARLAEQRDSVRQDVKMRKARQRIELFQDSLRTGLIRDGKIKIHQDVVNRIVASYRG